jgi:hypothetical protein
LLNGRICCGWVGSLTLATANQRVVDDPPSPQRCRAERERERDDCDRDQAGCAP